MNCRTHVIALSVSLCQTQLLLSQVDQASLTGSVTDQSGAVISGATIKTLAKESGQEREVTTNVASVYTIPNLTLGTYTVTVEKPGFATQKFSPVECRVGAVVALNAQMQLATTQTSTEVSATEPALNQTAWPVMMLFCNTGTGLLRLLSGESNAPQNVDCRKCDFGPNVFDVRYNVVTALSY